MTSPEVCSIVGGQTWRAQFEPPPGTHVTSMLANMQIKLSVLAVTVRACARPAPARPAAYLQR